MKFVAGKEEVDGIAAPLGLSLTVALERRYVDRNIYSQRCQRVADVRPAFARSEDIDVDVDRRSRLN
jgi:hypothetical protein